MEAIKG
jgi:transposase